MRRETNNVAAHASKAVCHCLYDGNTLNDRNACKQQDSFTPAVICLQNVVNQSKHRVVNTWGMFQHMYARAARPVSRNEMKSNAQTMKAMGKEWIKLRSKGVWDEMVVK